MKKRSVDDYLDDIHSCPSSRKQLNQAIDDGFGYVDAESHRYIVMDTRMAMKMKMDYQAKYGVFKTTAWQRFCKLMRKVR